MPAAVVKQRKKGSPTRYNNLELLLVGFVVVAVELILINVGVTRQQHHGVPQPSSLQSNSIPESTTEWRKAATVPPKITRVPDGTFNGYPIYLHEKAKSNKNIKDNDGGAAASSSSSSPYYYSSVHCIGENYHTKKSWFQRSCHYSLLCFDTTSTEFVVYQQPKEQKITQYIQNRSFMDVSQSFVRLYNSNNHNHKYHNNTVSLGGINQKWTMNKDGIPRLEWSPTVIVGAMPSSFYMLPPNVVLVPFHSLSGENPGHLVWDDFLPIYNLLHLFDLIQDGMEPLMLRYVLQGRGLWASCDWTKEKRKTCNKMHNKFLPLMTSNNQSQLTTTVLAQFNITTTTTSTSTTTSQQQQEHSSASNLVCAQHGVAGLGPLTDHGTVKLHGWEPNDYKLMHNYGRGWLFWEFRQFAMKNLGLLQNDGEDDYNSHVLTKRPLKIIFSLSSSSRANRNIRFTREMERLRHEFSTDEVIVESYSFKDYSLKQQVQIASEASIFISGCGGGAVTGTFVPRGASILLYYASDGGVHKNKRTYKPARLDWDLFNNLGYARVHWIDAVTMHQNDDLDNFITLIQHELEVIRHEFPSSG